MRSLTRTDSVHRVQPQVADPVTATALVQIAAFERPSQPPPPGCCDDRLKSAQYVSIKYSERLAEAGIEPSVGSVGDSFDNALAETVIGLFKTEVIHQRGPWRSFDAVEYATLEWMDWFNNRRLLPRRKRTTTRPLRSPGWPRSSQQK
jgi:transposase InsO family protein